MEAFSPWFEVITLSLLGLFALWGIFDKAKKQLNTEKDKMELDVINLLKEQVEALEKKVNNQEKTIRDLQGKVLKFEGENTILKNLLQGRDEESAEFKKKGFEAMERTQHVERIMERVEKNLAAITEIIKFQVTVSPKVKFEIDK